MVLGLASTTLQPSVKLQHAVVAARIVQLSRFNTTKGRLFMVSALVNQIAREALVTLLTLVVQSAGNQFPIQDLPLDLLASQIHHELAQVPLGINHVLLLGLAVSIDKQLCFGANLPLPLGLGEKCTAVDTAQQVLLGVFEGGLELLHI